MKLGVTVFLMAFSLPLFAEDMASLLRSEQAPADIMSRYAMEDSKGRARETPACHSCQYSAEVFD